ncbi:hypothetical protein [Arthrobacter sp. zg-Y1171]|uniref:hypothetical protein n=1 Tax=Arthrobacter sp. zg-Y1171 TaxID=2964610 RepID=UPI0021AF3528|nr:hypothetical protein [Arthrobacter sp. zg-Y1171]UWX81858.1 hypothetical protein N2L00_15995 [Arthrobacter sp. zg-Y1171]
MDSHGPVVGAQGNQGAPPPPGPGAEQQQPQQPHQPNPPAPQAPGPQGQWPQAAPPPPGGPGLPGQASKQPNPKRRKGLIIAGSVAAGLLVILGVGGFFGYKHLSETTYSPRVQAEEYLQALVDADVERAMEMAPATGDELDYSLMTNEVYSKATDRISGFEVTDVVVNDGTADVTVDVKQGDDTQAMKLELSENGTEAVFFKKWKLDAPLGSWSLRYTLDEDASEPAVNGVSVEMPEDGRKLAVLPGEYTFNAPTGTKFVSYGGDEKMSVRLDGQESLMGVAFIPEITDAAREEIKARTKAHLESCLKLTELQPKGCPNQADGEDPNNFRNIKWSMAKEPAYESIEGDPSFPFSVELVNGQFTLDAEMKEGDEWRAMKGTVELYSLPAMVDIQGETITMTFAD